MDTTTQAKILELSGKIANALADAVTIARDARAVDVGGQLSFEKAIACARAGQWDRADDAASYAETEFASKFYAAIHRGREADHELRTVIAAPARLARTGIRASA